MKLRTWLFWGASAGVCAALGVTVFAACSGEILVEVPPYDAGHDAAPPNDAAPPTDGGVQDADMLRDVVNVDVGIPPTLGNYVARGEAVICQRYAECCAANPGHDAGPGEYFDMAKCGQGFTTGWNGHAAGLDNVVSRDAGTVTLNGPKALECLQLLRTFTCPTVTGTEFKQIDDTCFAALTGTVAQGGACRVALECATGLYCALPTDGGANGRCQPLLATDAGCDISYNSTASGAYGPAAQCSPNGRGAACEFVDIVAQTDAKCGKSNLPNGTLCYTNESCASNLCDIVVTDLPPLCTTQTSIIPPSTTKDGTYYPGTCQGFASTDAGH